jgi:SAM-dependent methyltransferase
METETRSWDWWAYFFRVRHRRGLPGIDEWDERLVDFLVSVLDLDEGARVLDVGCGHGIHLKLLTEHAVGGLGFDVSESLVRHAREATADRADLVAFEVGDMRDIGAVAGDEAFDAATVLSGTFGLLGVEGDLETLRGIHGALAPGGRLLLDCVSPPWAARPRERSWEFVEDGCLLSETHYDPASCVRTNGFLYIEPGGAVAAMEQPERIRVYTLPELMGLLQATGFEFRSAHGSHALPPVPYDAANADRLVVVAQRPLR